MSEISRTDPSGLAPTGHDTHLYDQDAQDNQIIALYDTMELAHAARAALLAAGVDEAAIQVVDGEGASTLPISPPAMTEETTDRGFWSILTHLFTPHEDAHAYGTALERGHAMLVVIPAMTAHREAIMATLEATNPIDFDARLEEWRQTGYDYNSSNALRTETPTGAATGTAGAMGQVQDASGQSGRSGRREELGSGRVRSYVAPRPEKGGVRLHEETIGGTNLDTASTMGATTSGMNAPRPPQS